ncbi:hypothetical protein [Leucobacter aridicollis]|uniref:hypothetical protein n=1 Tax=Leucobacter aridicollis TaxID=283878 RepID=UPI002168DA64|nr:hypothetical protein [Leucobacter aridicollis]MCS3426729.1 hypothetical protein [Leucobacter aridicollis]
MTQPEKPQLPSPKILLPVGVALIAFSVYAFVFFDVHVVSGALAGIAGLAGLAMTVQSIMRLSKGER